VAKYDPLCYLNSNMEERREIQVDATKTQHGSEELADEVPEVVVHRIVAVVVGCCLGRWVAVTTNTTTPTLHRQ
jgi:hypothetical protein